VSNSGVGKKGGEFGGPILYKQEVRGRVNGEPASNKGAMDDGTLPSRGRKRKRKMISHRMGRIGNNA